MSEIHRGALRRIHHPVATACGAALVAVVALAAPAAHAQETVARSLAATCANCHGTNGNARGDMKPLVGMPAEKMTALLADFRAGTVPTTIMGQIVKGYTEEQIKLIAAYFAAQRPTAAK